MRVTVVLNLVVWGGNGGGEKGLWQSSAVVAITRARTISHDAENPTPQTRDDRFPCTLRKPQKMHALSRLTFVKPRYDYLFSK